MNTTRHALATRCILAALCFVVLAGCIYAALANSPYAGERWCSYALTLACLYVASVLLTQATHLDAVSETIEHARTWERDTTVPDLRPRFQTHACNCGTLKGCEFHESLEFDPDKRVRMAIERGD